MQDLLIVPSIENYRLLWRRRPVTAVPHSHERDPSGRKLAIHESVPSNPRVCEKNAIFSQEDHFCIHLKVVVFHLVKT